MRKIWQTWKTKEKDKIPQKLAEYAQKWKDLHPGYQYNLLDDEDLAKIVSEVFPEYKRIYDSFTHNIERVDFARYAILFREGGVYADMDMDPLKSVDSWVRLGKIVLGCEPPEHAKNLYKKEKLICNAIMISPPHQSFWRGLADHIISHYEHNYDPVRNTGPLALTNFIEKTNPDVVITNSCVFYPLKNDGKCSEGCDLGKSYTAHMWENSWVKPWYKDARWFNTRYWAYFLLCFVLVLSFFWMKKKSDPSVAMHVLTSAVIIFAIVIVFVFGGCRMRCNSTREGLSHRLPTTRILLDNAWAKTQLPDYSLRWPMDVSYGQNSHYRPGMESICSNSKIEGFDTLRKSCYPGEFYNETVGECQPRFQGVSSSMGVWCAKAGPPPDVSLSGSTLPEYGTGNSDPVDVPLQINGQGPVHLLVDL